MELRLLNIPFKKILLVLILSTLFFSVAGWLAVSNLRDAAAGLPLAANGNSSLTFGSGFQATYILSPADATATPTPFQPLAPTGMAVAVQVSAQPVELTAVPLSPIAATPTPNGAAPTASSPTPTGVPPTVALTPEAQMEKLPSQVNLLLLGSDRRPWDAGFRTDTIILVTINTDLGRVNITSFPRDLWVTLPGWGPSRINTAWTYGGYRMLHETFQHNFGITVDYHVLIDFSAFKKIVDGLGGLDVNVSEPVSDYRGGYWVTIPKGMQHMDADKVLWYARSRKTSNDIARNRRQQEVLMALFEKFVSMDALRKAPELYDLYDHSVKTDLNLLEVLRWLPFAGKIVETRDIHMYAITYKQVYDWITPEGAMVLVPKKDQLMKVIRQSQNLK